MRGLRTPRGRRSGGAGAELVPAGTGRIRMGRRVAAAGLLWQPARPGMSVRDQAALAGRGSDELPLAAARGGGRQIGFASAKNGIAPGMIAGASMFNAEAVGETWLGAFRIGDGGGWWWIAAMRDGLVFEDLVCGDEDSAAAAFRGLLDAPDWGRLFAPAEWEIEGAADAPLAELVSLRSAARLRPLNRTSRFIALGSAALIAAAAAAFVWSEYSDYRLEQAQREALASASAAAPSAPAPWRSAPSLAAFVESCARAMDRLAIEPPGWELLPLNCSWFRSGATVDARWRRKRGRIPFLAAAVRSRTGLRPELERSGSFAAVSESVDIPAEPAPVGGRPWPAGTLERILTERFQSLGLDLKLASRTADRRSPLRDALFGRTDLAIATSAALPEYARLLSDVPALVPESLSFDLKAGAWLLKARAFHRPGGGGA